MSLFDRRPPEQSNQERFWSLLGKHNTFMLVTKTDDRQAAHLRGRPMAGYPRPDEHRIWFLAHANGLKDDEIAARPSVCVTLANPSKQHFVSVGGTASVQHDLERKRELWSIAAQAWFPDGPEDPNIILICVDVEEGEFWDGDPNSIVVGVKMAKAVAEGRRVNVGEQGKVEFGRQQTGKPDSFAFKATG